MSISSGRRYFFLICGLLVIVNVLVVNDIATVWDGAEAAFLRAAHIDPAEGGTPAHFLSRWIAQAPTQTFLVRLPGVLVFFFTLAAIYLLSEPVLGSKAARWTILVLGSSFLAPSLAKLATLDIWTFGWHTLGYLTMLRFLKQPNISWRIAFYLMLALGIWMSPLSTLLLFAILPAILYWRHPQGKRLWRLQPWGVLLFLGLSMWGADWLDWSGQEQYLAPFSGSYYFYVLLGMFPFLGFLLGGLWELIGKLRRGEELALLNLSLLAAAFLAQSPAIQLALALLVAKQLHVYFQENYPYRGLVRTGAILHLVLAFLLTTLLMLGGFFQFEGIGFRSGLAFGAVYWMLSFIGVIGLFSGNRRYVWGATVASALLAMLLFWLQVYPLIESRRNIPGRLVEAADRLLEDPDDPLFLMPDGEWTSSNEVLYLKSAFPSLERVSKVGEQGNGLYIAPLGQMKAVPPIKDSARISGWTDRLKDTEWLLLDYRSGTLEDQVEQSE